MVCRAVLVEHPRIFLPVEIKSRMANAIRTPETSLNAGSAGRVALDEWNYPSGMVWCPMKRSGMAIMKCAEMQKHFGCGSVRQLRAIMIRNPANVPFFWPWLRRGRECGERADDKELRELRLALSPLKTVDKIRKNPRAQRCSGCGGRKAFGARQCRHCWRVSLSK
jgi:hypothetical protein